MVRTSPRLVPPWPLAGAESGGRRSLARVGPVDDVRTGAARAAGRCERSRTPQRSTRCGQRTGRWPVSPRTDTALLIGPARPEVEDAGSVSFRVSRPRCGSVAVVSLTPTRDGRGRTRASTSGATGRRRDPAAGEWLPAAARFRALHQSELTSSAIVATAASMRAANRRACSPSSGLIGVPKVIVVRVRRMPPAALGKDVAGALQVHRHHGRPGAAAR